MTSTSLITLLFMAIFFAVMLWIGLRSRKHAADINGFVLGSRQVGPWLSAFAYGTSYFSAVIFVGYAGQFGWNFGLASTWIGLGNAFIGSLLAWLILGRRTRIMTQHLGSKTMPDFFGIRYESDKLRTAASLITFLFLIPYTASLYNGLSRLFAIAFPGVDYAVCVVIMAALTGVYVILGGYMATAWNDFIQGIIMLFGIVAVIAAVLGDNGGLSMAMEKLATGATGGWQYASFLGANPLFLLFVVILTSLGTWGLPQMVGKFYAIKNESSIQKGTVISTLFAIVVAGGCYFLGGFDNVIPTMLQSLSPFLIAVVIILVLSASISTLSSLVLTSSSTLTLDFLKPFRKKAMDEKQQLTIMRVLIAVFIAISAVIAIFQYQSGSAFIAQMMGVSWGALAGAFLAPFLYGLYWKRATKAGCAASFLFSTVVMILNIVVKSSFPAILQSPINAGAFCMLAGMIIVPVVSILTRAPEKKKIDQIFSCYSRMVTVPATESIGDDNA